MAVSASSMGLAGWRGRLRLVLLGRICRLRWLRFHWGGSDTAALSGFHSSDKRDLLDTGMQREGKALDTQETSPWRGETLLLLLTASVGFILLEENSAAFSAYWPLLCVAGFLPHESLRLLLAAPAVPCRKCPPAPGLSSRGPSKPASAMGGL